MRLFISLLIANFVGIAGGCRNPDDGNAVSRVEAKLHKVAGCDDPDRRLDVVFLHGVEGDHLATWHPTGRPDTYWPAWLAEDVSRIGVWSLHYPAATTVIKGETMNLIDRGNNVLTLLEAEGFADSPDRPLVFIAHSFGGLVTKQMLENAHDSIDQNKANILGRTRGVIFIATPNSGSRLADFVEYMAGRLASTTVDDLKRGTQYLLKLNRWYRDHSPELGIKTMVFCEEQTTAGLMVVDKESADPGISGVTPVAMDRDHLTICKPMDTDDVLYKQVVRFLDQAKSPLPPPIMPDPLGSADENGAVNPPTEEDVSRLPIVNAERVVLTCENETRQALRLALYDWSRHFAGQNGVWRYISLPSHSGRRRFQDFKGPESVAGSTGYFSVYMVTADNEISDCQLTENFFTKRQPSLLIKERPLGPYVTFTFED